jgi:hypothetical protein
MSALGGNQTLASRGQQLASDANGRRFGAPTLDSIAVFVLVAGRLRVWIAVGQVHHLDRRIQKGPCQPLELCTGMGSVTIGGRSVGAVRSTNLK